MRSAAGTEGFWRRPDKENSMRFDSRSMNRRWAFGAATAAAVVALSGSCSDNQGRLATPTPFSGGTAGRAVTGGQSGSAGTQSTGGTAPTGGTAGAGDAGGEGGIGASSGTTASGGTGDTGGSGPGGQGGSAGGDPPERCIFGGSDDPGEGGEGGAPTLPPGVTIRTSPYVGKYLADATGRALYTWGGDLPGDCRTDPVSRCAMGCAPAWPGFHNAGSLPPEIPDDVVGTIPGPVTSPMTTYYGWPLYYYGQDMLDSMTMIWSIRGQGVGRIWHLAKLVPSNVVMMKAGTVLYLGDQLGMTLYTYVEDTVGPNPVSECTGDCLDDFVPLVAETISPVTSLEPSDFRLFVRSDSAEQQIAYKGAPLYRARLDQKSGDALGAAVPGFAIAAP
jgi:predicted lipoprotein with Yx(FWY)xxD motif